MKIIKWLVILVLVSCAAVVHSQTTVANPETSSLKNHWAKYDGGRVHYYDIGGKEKKALILIHGRRIMPPFTAR